jgi:hypothetical protein
MAFSFTEPRLGMLQIANVDTGVTSPGAVSSGATTVIPTPPATLGMVARAADPTLGEGEFILLLGVASTVVGSLVTYDATTFQTTLTANTANQARPVAVAMAATLAGQFGWYQIGGLASIKKTAVVVNPQVAIYQSATTGRVMPTAASGKQILGARSANLASVLAATPRSRS